MSTKISFNCATGEMVEVAMDGAELAAFEAQRAILQPVPKSFIQQVAAEDFRTTNATQATMVSWPLAQQTLYAARFTLLAIDTGNGDCRVWTARATAKRLMSGALLVGTPTLETSHADSGASAWAVAADASGNTFRVRVTGAAGRTISWSLLGEVVRARPDGLVD